MAATPTPGTPASVPDVLATAPLKEYRLFYRDRRHPHTLDYYFKLAADKPKAIQFCKKFCEEMNYVFIRVDDFWVDLQEILKKNQSHE